VADRKDEPKLQSSMHGGTQRHGDAGALALRFLGDLCGGDMRQRLKLAAKCSGSRVRGGSPSNRMAHNAAALLNSTYAAEFIREHLDVRHSLTSDRSGPATFT
jgi:hypothetical protein